MNKSKISYLMAIILFAVMGSVIAADDIILRKITGEVLVNQGETYATATEGMVNFPDDQLMVVEGGFAQITYPNDCVYMYTVLSS